MSEINKNTVDQTPKLDIAGRPSDAELATFAGYGEALPDPFASYRLAEVPAGWVPTGESRTKRDLMEPIPMNPRGYADELTKRHGEGNWGFIPKDEQEVILDIYAAGKNDPSKDLADRALQATGIKE